MLDIFAMFVPALLITLAARLIYHRTITNEEAIIMMGANLLIACVFIGGSYAVKYSKMHDTQLLSGYVMSKSKDRVSCEHSYDCNCRNVCSGSGNSRSCSRVCDTCYDHSYDIEWNVKTTLSNYEIRRIDRQGLKEPPRWTAVMKDEPVAESSSYINYLLADEKTLFVETLQKDAYSYPAYPTTFDYWKVNRVLGVPSPLGETLNAYVNDTLKTLGPAKQMNVVIVATLKPEDYFTGLMSHWKGGKKNDIIMVYGIDKDLNVVWFKSNSYAMGMGNIELHNKLKDNAVGKRLDVPQVTLQMATIASTFKRLPAKEFEFKAESIEISTTSMLILVLLNLFASIGCAVFMHVNELDNIMKNRR